MHGGGVELSLHSPLKGISPFNFCRNVVPLCRDVTKIKHYKNGLVSSGSPLHTGIVVIVHHDHDNNKKSQHGHGYDMDMVMVMYQ